MASGELMNGTGQNRGVQLTVISHAAANIVLGAARLHFIEKPESLLCERNRQRSIARYSAQRARIAERLGMARQRRLLRGPQRRDEFYSPRGHFCLHLIVESALRRVYPQPIIFAERYLNVSILQQVEQRRYIIGPCFRIRARFKNRSQGTARISREFVDDRDI